MTKWTLLLAAALAAGQDMQVVLCGTGSPIPDPDRASACTAIVTPREFIVIDVGPSSWRKVATNRSLPAQRLSAVLITHFHSDHIGDLGEAIVQSWIAGRSAPLEIYGPAGILELVSAVQSMYRFDAQYRTKHHGESNMPPLGAQARAMELNTAKPVIDRNGLRVTAFAVEHDPATPAVGYLVEFGGRKVVVSGDTIKSANVEKHAKGADLLIHSALAKDLVTQLSAMLPARPSSMFRDTISYHTSPAEAGEIAASAGVAKLVFTHMVPPPRTPQVKAAFLDAARAKFNGEIALGEDGMTFTLPSK
jgi:ribonuclease Z